jgi:hypothetical protein
VAKAKLSDDESDGKKKVIEQLMDQVSQKVSENVQLKSKLD